MSVTTIYVYIHLKNKNRLFVYNVLQLFSKSKTKRKQLSTEFSYTFQAQKNAIVPKINANVSNIKFGNLIWKYVQPVEASMSNLVFFPDEYIYLRSKRLDFWSRQYQSIKTEPPQLNYATEKHRLLSNPKTLMVSSI